LGEIGFSEFVELVVSRDVRPERPEDEDAPQLSDTIWELAEKCWVKNPKDRPTVNVLCDTLSHLLEITSITQPILNPSPLDSIDLAKPKPLPPVPAKANPPSPLTPPQHLTLRGHTKDVNCATFSPDGKYIVSGSDDGTIMVWDAHRGVLALGPLKAHTSFVFCVAFSPDGRQIASGSYDRTILIWDIVTGKVVARPFKGHTSTIWTVDFSPDGKKIASGSHDKAIRVWDVQTGVLLIDPLIAHTNAINCVTFSADGNQLASGSDDKTVRVWDMRSGRLIQGPLKGNKKLVWFVAFSLDGKRIVSASHHEDVCVFDVKTGGLLSGPSKQHTEGALACLFMPHNTWYCAVSPNGQWIASMNWNDHKVDIWDSKTGLLALTFTEHVEHVYSITFSPDSKWILSTSKDRTIQVHTLNL